MNQLKKQAESIKAGLFEKQLFLSENIMPILIFAGRLLLSAILSKAELFGGAVPFGLSFIAASGTGRNSLAALLGAICGYMLSGDFIWALKYIGTAILIYSANHIFKNTKVEK